MRDLDKLIKGLASTVTERCKQRIEEARKNPHPKSEHGIFEKRKQMQGL